MDEQATGCDCCDSSNDSSVYIWMLDFVIVTTDVPSCLPLMSDVASPSPSPTLSHTIEVIRLSIRIPYYLAPEIERTLNILHRWSVAGVQNYHQTVVEVRPQPPVLAGTLIHNNGVPVIT